MKRSLEYPGSRVGITSNVLEHCFPIAASARLIHIGRQNRQRTVDQIIAAVLQMFSGFHRSPGRCVSLSDRDIKYAPHRRNCADGRYDCHIKTSAVQFLCQIANASFGPSEGDINAFCQEQLLSFYLIRIIEQKVPDGAANFTVGHPPCLSFNFSYQTPIAMRRFMPCIS